MKTRSILRFILLGVFHMLSSLSLASSGSIAILGDVEGEWAKVCSFVNSSSVLFFNENETKISFKNKEDKFVFIGDSIDKGKSNIKVLRLLVELKETYPDQVTLIMGNRDINKLRFLVELCDTALDLRPDSNPMGRSDGFRVSFWAEEFAKFEHKLDGKIVEYTHGEEQDKDRALKMKFLFAKTLGSPHAFEDFKEECEVLENKKLSDLEIPGRYLKIFLDPESGLMTRFLKQAKVLHCEATKRTLMSHGFLTDANYLFVPGLESRCRTVLEWEQELNTWAQERIEAAFSGDMSGYRKALELISYQEPEVVKGSWAGPLTCSVIQGRPSWTAQYDIEPPSSEIIGSLRAQGICRHVSGHTPTGDIPTVMQEGGVEFLIIDTSMTKPPRNATVEITVCNHSDIKATLEGLSICYGTVYDSRTGVRSLSQEGEDAWYLGTFSDGRALQVFFKQAYFGRPMPFGAPHYEVEDKSFLRAQEAAQEAGCFTKQLFPYFLKGFNQGVRSLRS